MPRTILDDVLISLSLQVPANETMCGRWSTVGLWELPGQDGRIGTLKAPSVWGKRHRSPEWVCDPFRLATQVLSGRNFVNCRKIQGERYEDSSILSRNPQDG